MSRRDVRLEFVIGIEGGKALGQGVGEGRHGDDFLWWCAG